MELTDVKAYLYRMHNKSATHNWESFIDIKKDPFFAYKRIRDQGLADGETRYAGKIENYYLVLLRRKHHLAKRDSQKEVCERLKEEARQAMKSPYFNKSKICYSLTFYNSPLYWAGSFFYHTLRKLVKGEE